MLKSALLAVLAGIQFTCFTGTNVQILTLRTRRFASLRCASEFTRKMRVLRLLAFTGTKIQILTHLTRRATAVAMPGKRLR